MRFLRIVVSASVATKLSAHSTGPGDSGYSIPLCLSSSAALSEIIAAHPLHETKYLGHRNCGSPVPGNTEQSEVPNDEPASSVGLPNQNGGGSSEASSTDGVPPADAGFPILPSSGENNRSNEADSSTPRIKHAYRYRLPAAKANFQGSAALFHLARDAGISKGSMKVIAASLRNSSNCTELLAKIEPLFASSPAATV